MSFVIYNKVSFKRFRTPQGNESFATERAAKGVLTKMVNANVLNRDDWVIASYDDWADDEPMVTVYSIMDLKKEHPIQIRQSDRGGCCDPSMELYHTM